MAQDGLHGIGARRTQVVVLAEVEHVGLLAAGGQDHAGHVRQSGVLQSPHECRIVAVGTPDLELEGAFQAEGFAERQRMRGEIAHGHAHEHGFVLDVIKLDGFDDDRHLRAEGEWHQKQQDCGRDDTVKSEKHGGAPFS